MSEVNVEIVGQNQPVSGPNESIGIDFSTLKTKAAEFLDKAEAQAETPQVEAPAVAVKLEQPVVATPDPEQVAQDALDIADDQLVKTVVDGEERILPWKEARGKISGGLKFTQNQQQLAKERQALEAQQAHLSQLEQDRAGFQAFIRNKDAVLAYAKQAFGEPSVQPQGDNPEQIATLGDARTIAEQSAKRLEDVLAAQEKVIDGKIATAQAAIHFEQQRASHAVAIDTTLKGIFTENPVLKRIPNIEDVIRFEVAKTQPKTEAEAIEAFRQVSQGIVEDLGQHYVANKKLQAAAVAKQKLEKKTIEPAVGSAPQTTPANYKDAEGRVDSKKVFNIAKQYLDNL